MTLGAFGSTDNGAASGFSINNIKAVTPDTGWTEIHEQTFNDVATGEDGTLETQWRNDNDTTAVASWTGNSRVAGIAIEIKFAAAVVAVAEDESYVMVA